MKRNATNIVWAGSAAFVLMLLGAASAGCDAREASANTPNARIERGKYLVNSVGCNDCHTPWKMGPQGPEPDMTRMLSGHPEAIVVTAPAAPPSGVWENGMVFGPTMTSFSGPWGVSFAANLTPDQNTGLGIWTEEMFVKAIRTGRHFGVSRPILPPMPWPAFRNMTDEDLRSVFAYLRSIPPITNHVPDPIPPAVTTN